MTGTLRDSLMALSEEVRVVDLHERVLRGSRRMKMRNRAIGAVAAFLALSGSAVAVAAVRPSPTPVPPVPSTSPSPSSSPSSSPAPSPTQAVALPNVDVKNATFEVPAYPTDNRCLAATRTFKNGTADVGPGQINPRIELKMAGEPVRGDVDGEPGDEILIRLSCFDYSGGDQVLALKVAPDGKLSPLGFVMMSPDHQRFTVLNGTLRLQREVVLVDVLGPPWNDGPPSVIDLQTRGYAYRGGKFVQVSGPTKFATPPDDYRKVDFRNVTAMIWVPGMNPEVATAFVRLVDGKATTVIDKVTYEVTVVSSAFFPELVNGMEARLGVVLYRLKPATGQTRTFVNIYPMPTAIPAGEVRQITGVTDLAGATKVATSGSELLVTINGQVKTYREGPDGNWVSSA